MQRSLRRRRQSTPASSTIPEQQPPPQLNQKSFACEGRNACGQDMSTFAAPRRQVAGSPVMPPRHASSAVQKRYAAGRALRMLFSAVEDPRNRG